MFVGFSLFFRICSVAASSNVVKGGDILRGMPNLKFA